MEIKYKIDRAKRKNIYICIKDGEVIVKGPKLMSDARAEKVVKEKEKWILKKLSEENKSTRKQKEEEYLSNEKYYRKKAEQEIDLAMDKMIAITGLVPSEYRIFNFKKAWGNCSSKKVIKINPKLIMYSNHTIDYVCLHELCHLKYMNHSKKFWDLVEKYMPDYKEAEEDLKC